MKTKFHSLSIFLLLFLFPLLTFSQLTGYWQTDVGGCYQIRQNGNEIWWAGEASDIQRPKNVFHGTIAGDILTGQWCDLPSSSSQGCEETLALRIESNNRLVKISSSASYNGSVWTKQADFTGCGQCTYNLTGQWRSIHGSRNAAGYSIVQDGNQLTLSYSGDGTSATATCSGVNMQLTGWANVSAVISNGGNRIDFSNGSYWIRL
jgi:hypothetical protein